MTSAFKFTLATLVVLPLISACVTPQTKQVESLSPENKLFSDVQFTLNEQFKERKIKCITVGNLQITDENAGYPSLPKERLVRQAIIGNLTSKNYEAIPLKEFNETVQPLMVPGTGPDNESSVGDSNGPNGPNINIEEVD